MKAVCVTWEPQCGPYQDYWGEYHMGAHAPPCRQHMGSVHGHVLRFMEGRDIAVVDTVIVFEVERDAAPSSVRIVMLCLLTSLMVPSVPFLTPRPRYSPKTPFIPDVIGQRQKTLMLKATKVF